MIVARKMSLAASAAFASRPRESHARPITRSRDKIHFAAAFAKSTKVRSAAGSWRRLG